MQNVILVILSELYHQNIEVVTLGGATSISNSKGHLIDARNYSARNEVVPRIFGLADLARFLFGTACVSAVKDPIGAAEFMGNTACYAWDSACNKAAAYVGEHDWHTGSALMHDCGDYASNAWETFKEKDIRTQCRILSKGGLEFISIVSGVGAAVSGTKVTLNATKIAGGAATAQKTTQVFNKCTAFNVAKELAGLSKSQIKTVLKTAQAEKKEALLLVMPFQNTLVEILKFGEK